MGHNSKESCPVRPIPAYKAGLYGLTEDRQLSESNSKPPFIPVHRTGFSGCFNKEDIWFRKSPLAPLCQRGGLFLPFVKGGEEGFALRCLYYRLINKFQGNLETQYVIFLTLSPNSQSSNLPAGSLLA